MTQNWGYFQRARSLGNSWLVWVSERAQPSKDENLLRHVTSVATLCWSDAKYDLWNVHACSDFAKPVVITGTLEPNSMNLETAEPSAASNLLAASVSILPTRDGSSRIPCSWFTIQMTWAMVRLHITSNGKTSVGYFLLYLAAADWRLVSSVHWRAFLQLKRIRLCVSCHSYS